MNHPNILLITADDMDGATPGTFGGPHDATPRLDALAAEGMLFRRAHVAVAVCQPSRSAIMTGLWPHRNGAEGFEPISDDVPLLTELLARVGYRTGILGKVNHLQPTARFGWDTIVEMRDLGLGRSPARYREETETFLSDAGTAPWFLMVNAHDPHRPFHGADDVIRMFGESAEVIPDPSKVFTPGEAPVPGFLPDLPDVREEFAQYLSSARRCDDVVNEVLGALDRSGMGQDTVVVFLSDNGMAFPFAKANCYLQSTHTPLIVRWPGVVAAGSEHAAGFVNSIDLFPTFCAIAGVDPGETDGRSLLPELIGDEQLPQEHVVTVFHETAAKGRYEMRCVQDEEYGYIWNDWADGEAEYHAENMMGLTWPAMAAAAQADPSVAQRVAFYRSRTGEELYHFPSDPFSLVNLASHPAHTSALLKSRARMRAWMEQTQDPLLAAFGAVDDLPQTGRLR